MQKSSDNNITLPCFETMPYGGKMRLDENTVLLVIAPHINTSAGISEDKLKLGLRPHPGIHIETVTFLRYADSGQTDSSKALTYRRLVGTNVTHFLVEPQTEPTTETFQYGPGAKFFSVSPDNAGYWHVLENTSDRSIMLLIKAVKVESMLRKQLIHD